MMAAKTPRMTKTVLVVDDDAAIVRMLKDAIGLFRHEHAYTVVTAGDGADGLAALQRDPRARLLLDMFMPRGSALQLLAHMRPPRTETALALRTGDDVRRAADDAP